METIFSNTAALLLPLRRRPVRSKGKLSQFCSCLFQWGSPPEETLAIFFVFFLSACRPRPRPHRESARCFFQGEGIRQGPGPLETIFFQRDRTGPCDCIGELSPFFSYLFQWGSPPGETLAIFFCFFLSACRPRPRPQRESARFFFKGIGSARGQARHPWKQFSPTPQHFSPPSGAGPCDQKENSLNFVLACFSGVAPQGKLSPFFLCFSYLPAGPAPALTARALDVFSKGIRQGPGPLETIFFQRDRTGPCDCIGELSPFFSYLFQWGSPPGETLAIFFWLFPICLPAPPSTRERSIFSKGIGSARGQAPLETIFSNTAALPPTPPPRRRPVRLYRETLSFFFLACFSGVAPQGKLSQFFLVFPICLPAPPPPSPRERSISFFQGDRPGAILFLPVSVG